MLFSEILKLLREEKDLKQDDVAKYMNVDRSTVGKWESSPSKPDYEKLIKLADFFNVSLDYLLGRTNVRNPYEIETIAAHHDGDDWTEEELSDIEKFKEYVRTKRES